MKKKFCAFLLAFTLAFQAVSFQPRQAHAVAGIVVGATGGTGAFPIMGVFMGVLVSFGAWGSLIATIPHFERTGEAAGLATSLSFLALGIALLDEESGAVSLGALSDEVAAGAGLTAEEYDAYMLELPELNRALGSAVGDLVAAGVTSFEEAQRHPEALEARTAHLMPETRSAFTKVRAYMSERAAAQN